MILALDPGTTETGWALLTASGTVANSGVLPNAEMLRALDLRNEADTLAIEMIASYGMAVGREVFETCVWIGRFQQAWHKPDAVRFVYRRDVKLHLCHNPRAKDPNIRQALLDKLGPQGTKKAPGPTYGVKSHAWAALAVAVTAYETQPKPTQAAPLPEAEEEGAFLSTSDPRDPNPWSDTEFGDKALPAFSEGCDACLAAAVEESYQFADGCQGCIARGLARIFLRKGERGRKLRMAAEQQGVSVEQVHGAWAADAANPEVIS